MGHPRGRGHMRILEIWVKVRVIVRVRVRRGRVRRVRLRRVGRVEKGEVEKGEES